MISILKFVIDNRKFLFFGLFALGMTLFVTIAYFQGRADGTDICQNQQTKEVVKYVQKESQAWANRPRSDADAIARLRDSARKRESN